MTIKTRAEGVGWDVQACCCPCVPKGSWRVEMLEQQRAAFSSPGVVVVVRYWLSFMVLHHR